MDNSYKKTLVCKALRMDGYLELESGVVHILHIFHKLSDIIGDAEQIMSVTTRMINHNLLYNSMIDL